MNLEEKIQSLLIPLVKEEVTNQLDGLVDGILSCLQRPEFESWGKYLNYDQTAKYLGIGKSGLKKRLARFDIHPLIFNEREKVFDRYELDRLKVNELLENYKNKIENK